MEKLKSGLPHIVIIILFLITAFAYFPDVLEGKKLDQTDVKTWKGGSQEITNYKKETGEHSLWTNSMFGGMPTYLVTTYAPSNIARYFSRTLELNQNFRPASFVFLALLGFYIALLLFGVSPVLSAAGAAAFAFSSYFIIIIEAGHLTKVLAMGFMPPIIAGVYHSYNKNAIVGAIATMIFLASQLVVNHLQITYYTLIIVLFVVAFQFAEAIKEKTYKPFLKKSAILGFAAIVAVSTNFSQLLTTYDYGKDSTRGPSELTLDKKNQTTGLDKDYATDWSYGKLETFNLLIPNLMGGASSGNLSEKSRMYDELSKLGVENPGRIVQYMPTYWGPQPFTSGPVYLGAVVIFLFVLAMFLVKSKIKWWLFALTLLSIFLAWGKNFMPLTDFFLNYVPGYNKFRTVSMILVIAQFTVPVLAFLALKDIIENKISKEELFKSLKWSAGIVVGIILVFLINPGLLDFKAYDDKNTFMQMFGLTDDTRYAQLLNDLTSALQDDRKSIFRADAFRSLFFVGATAGVILLWAFKIFKNNALIASIAILILVDLWVVDKRYLNSDDFVASVQNEQVFIETAADKFILKDTDKNFRVLNLSVNTFNDASTSYFHKSIGGYHGVKMKRYQELITYVIGDEMSRLIKALNESTTEKELNQTVSSLHVLNMLNTKYIILAPAQVPMMNSFRLGNAWFVENVKKVENADEELLSLKQTNPAYTAIVDKRFESRLFEFKKDTTAEITLQNYAPNKLSYSSSCNSDQLAVFSEIYYEKGWNAYIDGKLVPHFRADYVLRALKVPAGKHQIEFKFEPAIWKLGNTVSLIGSVLFILIILAGLFILYKNKTKIAEK